MKILHVLSQMPDFTGSGKTVQAIIRQAGGKGHDNFLVAGIQNEFDPEHFLLPKEKTAFLEFNGKDLDFLVPGMSDVMPYPSTIFSSMSPEQLSQYEAGFKNILEQAKERFVPDLIHSHHLWIVSQIARHVFPETPIVTSCHGTCLRQFSLCPRLGRAVQREISALDAILCLSQSQKKAVQNIHSVNPEKLYVVGAGFDQDQFFPGPKAEEGPIEIVYAGKLSRAKGVPWLLRALKQVTQDDVTLHLAGSGSGSEYQECLDLATGLSSQVKVHGPLSQQELAKLLRKAHIFVLPSFFEGLPLVLLEALSSGCRLLTTNLPGTCEILGDLQSDMIDLVSLPPLETVDRPFESDWPVLEKDLAMALDRVIQKSRIKRLPNLAQVEKLSAVYSWEKVFARMEAVYRKVTD